MTGQEAEKVFEMSGYDVYVLVVCLVTFLATFCVLAAMLFVIVRQEFKAIRYGLVDDRLVDEYMDGLGKRFSFTTILYLIFTVIVVVVTVLFGWTFSVRFSNPKVEGALGVPRVVLSGSMAYKLESNTYLEENGLDDQFDTFDLIITHELPGEFELELYDVVVYDIRGELVVHRIVGIEEPNEKHPDHRLFELRGDAMKYSDTLPVKYSQMMSIYRGEHAKYVGSFVHFMQSPAGYLCVLLMIIGCIVSPLTELFIKKAKKNRLRLLGYYY